MDDLSSPLGLKPLGGRRFRLPLGIMVAAALVVCGGGLALWMTTVSDPNGGEPSAKVPIEKASIGIDRGDITTVGVKSGAGMLLDSTEHAPADPGKAANAPTGGETPGVEIHGPGGAIGEVRLSIGADPALIETGSGGPLPRIAADGRRPVDVYARPVPASVGAAPKVAMIVSDLGLSQTTTQDVIAELPPEVTLAFAPYGGSLDRWSEKARQEGHELLLQIPLEPFDYPDNDPGPETLLTGNTAGKNLGNLHALMGRIVSYVGLVNYMGGKFTSDEAAFDPFLAEVAKRGLMYVEDGVSGRSLAAKLATKDHTPFVKADVAIGPEDGPDDLAGRFAQLEQVARSRGTAIGMVGARPATVAAIASWVKGLDSRGIVLVPITAMLAK